MFAALPINSSVSALVQTPLLGLLSLVVEESSLPHWVMNSLRLEI